MAEYVNVAVDAMGGDNAPGAIIKGSIEAINEAIYKLKNFESGSLVQKNKIFMSYLQNGVEVKYVYNGEECNSRKYATQNNH